MYLIVFLVAACGSNNGNGGGGDDNGVDATPFTNGVSTLAGSSEAAFVDGDRITARFSNPVNVAQAPDGRVVVADFDNSKLRIVDSNGNVTTVGITQMGFQRPFGLAFAQDGTLFVSTDNDPNGGHDTMSGTVWRVDINAGTATPIAVRIGRPRSLAVMPDGQLAMADDQHHVVEILNPTTAVVTKIAGTWDAKGMVDAVGTAARFSTPYGVAVMGNGLVVVDFDNNRIRTVGLDGSVSTFAGSGVAGFADGSLTAAQFSHPQAISAAGNGDLFVTDLGNFRIRKISGNAVSTVAGNGTGGWLDSDDRLSAEFYGLEGLDVTADGSMIFVADGNRGEAVPFNRVRLVKF
jgi:glucose/arabinose dehydrogenase